MPAYDLLKKKREREEQSEPYDYTSLLPEGSFQDVV